MTRIGLALLGSMLVARPSTQTDDLIPTLQRVGAHVQRYFTRAQTLICLETVRLQPLTLGLTMEGLGRNVESELRVSWEPAGDPGTIPTALAVRRVLKVNGHAPRKNDSGDCTDPEQNAAETHPLSVLLPGQREKYRFSVAGRGKVDGRAALLLDFVEIAKPSVKVEAVGGRDDCISFDINGGSRGRIWVDSESDDVLRLDTGLAGLVDVPLPDRARRNSGRDYWTVERLDSSIRFKPVSFQDPPETLMLPVSMSQLRITRGAGTPRLRTSTEYTAYRRFLTGGRVVPQ